MSNLRRNSRKYETIRSHPHYVLNETFGTDFFGERSSHHRTHSMTMLVRVKSSAGMIRRNGQDRKDYYFNFEPHNTKLGTEQAMLKLADAFVQRRKFARFRAFNYEPRTNIRATFKTIDSTRVSIPYEEHDAVCKALQLKLNSHHYTMIYDGTRPIREGESADQFLRGCKLDTDTDLQKGDEVALKFVLMTHTDNEYGHGMKFGLVGIYILARAAPARKGSGHKAILTMSQEEVALAKASMLLNHETKRRKEAESESEATQQSLASSSSSVNA
ncbi:hypothetical protein BDV96DRAFT_652549 [Lophiotrema nucula]|uniref:Uncharacterized protein n=1 Tax=Lophiotrema nucula TaxID=690887 RepID=A0A6A5YRB8_9PLEO|nr:hypothetical protein BDV96DRAFT_652549 [Lophiotrema nucula]